MILTLEKRFLKIPTWSPTQDRAHVEVLAEDMTHHVFGVDPFGWLLIMQAAGRMDVMIA